MATPFLAVIMIERWRGVFVAAIGLALVLTCGCYRQVSKKGPSEGMEKGLKAVAKVFKGADAPTQALLNNAMETLMKNEFEKGAAAMIALQNAANMTPEQAKAVANLMRQFQVDLVMASGNGDQRAQAAIDFLRTAGAH